MNAICSFAICIYKNAWKVPELKLNMKKNTGLVTNFNFYLILDL